MQGALENARRLKCASARQGCVADQWAYRRMPAFIVARPVAEALTHLKATGISANGTSQYTCAEFCELVDRDFHKGPDERYGH